MWILKLKHWQVFLFLILALLLSNTEIEGQETLSVTIWLIGSASGFLWPLFVGHSLSNLADERLDLNYTFFIINAFIWSTAYLAAMILSDGEGMTLTGVAAIPGFYVFFAFLYYLAFPAKCLKALETKQPVSFGNYVGDFFLVVFLPIGIWFLQPRINKIYREMKAKELQEQQPLRESTS